MTRAADQTSPTQSTGAAVAASACALEGEPYDAEEIMEAAQAIPEMHAGAVRRCLTVAKLLSDVRAMTGWPMQASLVSTVEELGRVAESLRLATSRPATNLAEAEAVVAAIDDALAAFNTSSEAIAAAVTAAVGSRTCQLAHD